MVVLKKRTMTYFKSQIGRGLGRPGLFCVQENEVIAS